MSRDPSQDPKNEGQRAKMSVAKSQERIAPLYQRRSPLSPEEADLLHAEYRTIMAAYHTLVWNRLRRRRLERHEAWELYQDVFLELYNRLVEEGFPDTMEARILKIVEWKILGHVGAKKGDPATEALPSSGSERPRSAPDLDRAMDLRALSRHIVPLLPPEHQQVIDKVVYKGLSHSEAAEVLGLTEGQLKGRLAAAERTLRALAKPLVPPSQRGLA